jgi:hypothetical protein
MHGFGVHAISAAIGIEEDRPQKRTSKAPQAVLTALQDQCGRPCRLFRSLIAVALNMGRMRRMHTSRREMVWV